MHAGRSSDGRNVPVSVDCAPFHFVEPTTEPKNTAMEKTSTGDDGPTAVIDAQHTGYMATGSVDGEPPEQPGRRGQGQGQGRVPGDSGPQTQNPDTPSRENDDAGDVLRI